MTPPTGGRTSIARPARVALALLVASAYTLVGWSLATAPPPIEISLAVLLGLATVVTLGVFFLNLGVFVDVISRGAADRSLVGLTFDDGPHPVHTRRVLDALDASGHRATFFVVGTKVEAHPDVVREIVERGHEVGLHGYDHDRFLNLRNEARIVRDLEKNRDAIERACGVRPRIFRPPVGFTSPRTRVAVRALGLAVVGWTARAFDGAGKPTQSAVLARVSRSLRPGGIILLHDARERGEDAPASVEALPALLDLLAERGLRSVTVTELCTLERSESAHGATPAPSVGGGRDLGAVSPP
ncbi:MAG TPA: polysaccharide deacetylase family protein [Polyangiaceae bacterium]|nr:polysaccharide deacetylase family protein [Polyangiaceae bacterium]